LDKLEIKGQVSNDVFDHLVKLAHANHRSRIKECGRILTLWVTAKKVMPPELWQRLEYLLGHPVELSQVLQGGTQAQSTAKGARKAAATENVSNRVLKSKDR